MPNPLQSLKILLRKDNAVVVLAIGLMYTVYACNIATLSTLCIEIYGLNEWPAGLIYLPFGLGRTVSTFFSGWLLDTAYKNARTKQGLSTALVRCDLAAIAVAFLEDMIHAISIGQTFTFVGDLCLVVLGLFAVEYCKGMGSRREARDRDNRR